MKNELFTLFTMRIEYQTIEQLLDIGQRIGHNILVSLKGLAGHYFIKRKVQQRAISNLEIIITKIIDPNCPDICNPMSRFAVKSKGFMSKVKFHYLQYEYFACCSVYIEFAV